MRISQTSIDAVRDAADIVEVASEFTALRRQGNRFVGLCPYPDHDEKTGSFSVTAEQGFYYCFGCQRGGDAIKLVTELKSLPFAEAISYLADHSNVELQYEGSRTDSDEARKRHEHRRSIHKALAAAAVYYHKILLNSKSHDAKSALEYLKERGFSQSTIEEFRLGYAHPRGMGGLEGVAKRLGLSRKVLEDAGLLSRGGERFAGRVTFPISDRRGRIVGFGARAMGDDQPKYLNSPETQVFDKRSLLYGFPQVTDHIRKERAAILVEGYTDVLMMYQSGIKNTVATLGTATSPAHFKTLSGYADRIFALFDPDAAGEKAIERAAATAAEMRLDLRVARLDADPADWLREHPVGEFGSILNSAEPALAHVFRRKADSVRGADAATRSRVLDEVRGMIFGIEDPVFKREAIRLAAEALGVDAGSLEGRYPGRSSSTGGQPQHRKSRPETPREQAGRDVLTLIISRPDLTAGLIEGGLEDPSTGEVCVLMPGDFGSRKQAELFAMITRHVGKDLDSLFSDPDVGPFMDYIGRLAASGEGLFPTEVSVREAWLRLLILSRQDAIKRTDDYTAKESLRQEVQSLRAALRDVARS